MRVFRQFSGKGLWNRVFRCAACTLILALCLPAPGAFAPVSARAASPNTASSESLNAPDAQRPAAAPRSLSSILTEQAASFLGVPSPIQPGMDEGLGFHQDGTVRKAGGTGHAGPSDNGQRAAAYMRSGLNGYGSGFGPGFGMNNGMAGPNLFRFRVLNGFDKFMAGQAVQVSSSGAYLAEAAPTQPASFLAWAAQWLDELISVKAAFAAGFASRSYGTNGRGEFLVELEPSSLPPGGSASVSIRAGDNQQTFTLNGNAAPASLISIINVTNGPSFTSGTLYSTASFQAKVVDASGNPVNGATVTWSVLSAQNNAPAMMSGWGSKKTGLTWGNVPEPNVTYADLQQERIASAPPPTAATSGAGETPVQQLTDIVGQREITIQAKVTIDGTDYTATQPVSFGNGPLSVFSKVGTGGVQWSPNYDSDNSRGNSSSFQYPSNTFPAAAFCGGTVNNDVAATGSAGSSSAGFDRNSGGWSADYTPVGSIYQVRNAENSHLPTTEQLLAVAAPNSSYTNVPERQGAAVAAGWLDASYYAWTGEVHFYGSIFGAMFVYLDNGHSGWNIVFSTIPVAVCRR